MQMPEPRTEHCFLGLDEPIYNNKWAHLIIGSWEARAHVSTSRTTSQVPLFARSSIHTQTRRTIPALDCLHSPAGSPEVSPTMHPLHRLLLLLLLPAVTGALAPPRFPSPHARPRPRPRSRVGAGVGGYEYETRYFRQRLDHFSFLEEEEAFFEQRYLVGGAGGWAGPGGPIFFYCGNEGDIAWFAANSGLVWDAAPRFSALVVFAEATILLLLLVVFNCLFVPC